MSSLFPRQDNAPASEETLEVEGPKKTRTRRGAVSGSVMTEEQATSYVKKVCSLVKSWHAAIVSNLQKNFCYRKPNDLSLIRNQCAYVCVHVYVCEMLHKCVPCQCSIT